MRLAVVSGNPRPASRTLSVGLAVADRLAADVARPADRVVVDVATLAAEIFDPHSRPVALALGALASSDLVVVASPTYKATYTGLLKAFVDRLAPTSLAGTVAVPVMTGGSAVHALAVEVALRPLLVELGATVPTRGLFVTEGELADVESVLDPWAVRAVPALRAALGQSGSRAFAC